MRRATAGEWFEQGVACEKRDCPEEAVHAYKQALGLRPDFAEAWFNLGTILWECGLFDDAQDAFARAVRHEPRLAAAWYNWGCLLSEIGQLDQAINSLTAAVNAAPDYADAHYNLAQCYEWAGRRRDAHRHWRRYLQLDYYSEWANIARRNISGI